MTVPAMPSQAYQRLSTRLVDIDQLIDAHKLVGGAERGRRWRTIALNRAAVVLLVAHLEGFLEDLVHESVDVLRSSGVRMKRIPLALRAAQLSPELRALNETRDPERREPHIDQLGRKARRLWKLSRHVRPGHLDPNLVTSGFSSPKTAKINSLFSILGLPRVTDGVSWRHASNYNVKNNLNELVRRRHAIAHGRSIQASKDDVIRYRRYVEGLAKWMNRCLCLHLHTIIGRRPWGE